MPDSTLGEPFLEMLRRSGGFAITLEDAAWLVWPSKQRSGVSAAMSRAQFVHFNAPVLAVQRNGRMEYFDEDGQLRWTSNLPWPRASLEMARLPGCPAVLEEGSLEEDSTEEDSPAESSSLEANEDSSTSPDEPND